MNSERYMLDTSALMAMMEGEPGAERVKELLSHAECLIPWMVLFEISYVLWREQGEAASNYRYVLIRQTPALVLWEVDEPLMMMAARFKAQHPLSIADAMIAAYAYQHNAVLIHKDPELAQLSELVRMEILPYK